ncbi:hypothetical protein [Streptomyces halstedii]|uniref:hypothetical protein n=1 Tax=Streptomyces halstedii TaxID=1944 RepID=UPI0036A524DA
MTPSKGLMRVPPGRRIVLNGVEWTIESVEAHLGRVMLADGAGGVEARSFRWLINHPDLRVLRDAERESRSGPPRQPGSLADLTPNQLERARIRSEHVRERFPGFPTEKIPSRYTLTVVWEGWFGPGGARPRYQRTADAAADAGVSGRVVVHRPGQALALDSTPLPVKLRESVFGEAATATLTLALDLYTHGLPAFRLTLQSTPPSTSRCCCGT